jgi:SAM-dependent methyltransferase
MKQIKLNLGCGTNKIQGYIGLDIEKSCKPDIIHDFIKKPLPFKTQSINEIVFFHTIEHLPKSVHFPVLIEIFRVLKKGAKVYITYPDFWECATRWKKNERGKRDFWHATIFGRQLYPSDYHVCAMDPVELDGKLREIGFINIITKHEKSEPYNAITIATKGPCMLMKFYEQQLAEEFNKTKIDEQGTNKHKSK